MFNLNRLSSVISSRLGIFATLSAEYVLLWLAHVRYVSDLWGYQGFNNSPSMSKFLISWVVIFLFSILSPRRKDVVLFFSCAMYVFVLIPLLVIYSASDFDNWLVVRSVVGVTVVLAAATLFNIKTIRLPEVRDRHIIFFLLMLCALNLIGIIWISGFKYLNFDVLKVYDFREDARRALPGFFGYLYAFSVKAALPIAFVLAARNGARLHIALVVFFSIMFFALTANRAPLFQILLIGGVYWMLGRKNSESYFLAGMIFLVLMGVLSFGLSPGSPPTLGTFVVYRMLLIPALISWQYFDYFGVHGRFFQWADSKITLGLVDSPDSLPMINVIGDEYWGSASITANVGWLGSGYGNGGMLGILLYSVLLGVVIAYVHAYGKKVGNRVSISLMFMPIFHALTGADFVTLLISQGLGMAMLVLALLSPRKVIQPNWSTNQK